MQKFSALLLAMMAASGAIADANTEWTFNYTVSGARAARPQVHGDANELFFQFPVGVKASAFTLEDCDGRARTVKPDVRGPYLVIPAPQKQARITTNQGLIKVADDHPCEFFVSGDKAKSDTPKPLAKPVKTKPPAGASASPVEPKRAQPPAKAAPAPVKPAAPVAETKPAAPDLPTAEPAPKEVNEPMSAAPVSGCDKQAGEQCLDAVPEGERPAVKDSAFHVEPAKGYKPEPETKPTPPVETEKPAAPVKPPVVKKEPPKTTTKSERLATQPPVIKPAIEPVKAAPQQPAAPAKLHLAVRSGESLRAAFNKSLGDWGLVLSWNMGRDRLSTRDYHFVGDTPSEVIDQALQAFELKGWLAEDSKTLYIVKESDQ